MSTSMQAGSITDSTVPTVPTEPIWRLTVNQYHAMIRAGILTAEHSVELLRGWLVPKMPKNPLHRAATRLLQRALEGLVPIGWYVDTQEPITTADSEPEPDAVVVRGETRQYLDRHPGPQDLALVVEVADTTLQRDRTSKKRLYAQAQIPVYWIVNLIDRQVEVYTLPLAPGEPGDYESHHDYSANDEVPLVIDGKDVGRVVVRDVLP
jgi:Uma2 family endonuclease